MKLFHKINFILSTAFISFFLLTAAHSSVWADESTPAPAGETSPVQVHGDTVEYFHEEEKVVGTGNVSIDQEGVRLTADKITVYMAKKLAIAEGNVVLKQKGSEFKGKRAEYDFGKKVGNVSEMDATIDPSLFGKAKRVEKISDNQYRASDAYITTCCGDNPFYKIQAQHIDIYPEKKVVIKNAMLLIRGVPILFIPYYVQPLFDFERFPVQLLPGKNSEWGPFLLSKWRYNLVNTPSAESKGNLLFDYRDKRGFGYGAENFYRGDKIGRGTIKGYYIDDKEYEDNSDRYRGQWRHQSKLTPSTTLTAEINRWSDADVTKDFFFREEYEKNVFPDNYVSIITAKPEYTLSFLERERLNRFSTVVEKSPEIRFDTYNKQFADTPFYLRQEMQFDNLKKEYAESKYQEDAVRLDSNHTLTYAGHIGDLSVAPHIGTRQTLYSRTANSQSSDVRGTLDGGVDVSIRYFKTYDASIDAFGLDYNGIRHVITPTASYNVRPTPNIPRTLLQQFDALDAIDKQNFVRLNYENKFMTKHKNQDGSLGASREIARIIPFTDFDFVTGRLENAGIDVELRPYTWLSIETDATYNTRTDQIDTANADMYIGKEKLKFGIGQRYLREESSQTTAEVRWKVSPDVDVKIYERYEFETGDSKEFEFTLSKAFECIIVDFTYNHRDGGDTFYFMFRLKAFPSASFSLSQSYDRPKAPASVPATAQGSLG